MSGDDITVRPGEERDAHDAFQVFRLAINEFHMRTCQPPVSDRDDQSSWYLHVLRHDAERFWVAERKRRLVGFSAAIVRGSWWFLSNLFVLPQRQGRGVGRELLERALSGALEAGVQATITEAMQPVSNTMYGRHDMLPWLPLVSYRAPLERVRLARPAPQALRAAGLEAEPLDEANVGELRPVDMAVLGFDKGLDHRFLVGPGGRRGWLFRRAGLPVAYGMCRPGGSLGPLACSDEADVGPVLLHLLAALVAERAAVLWSGVPSVNVAAQRLLLEAGFAYEAPPALLLASRPFGHMERYLPASFGMM